MEVGREEGRRKHEEETKGGAKCAWAREMKNVGGEVKGEVESRGTKKQNTEDGKWEEGKEGRHRRRRE